MTIIDKHPTGSFCWIELGTLDQNAAKKFYSALFGWSSNDFPMGPKDFYTMFELDGQSAAAAYTLRPDQQSQGVPPHWMLYAAVDSADAAAGNAARLGGKVCAPAFDVMQVGRMAVLQDPTGATFCVWQAKQHKGTGIAGVEGTLCWADLSTPDQSSAAKFYSDLLGWKMIKDEKDSSGYLHIKNGEEFIGGVPPASQRAPNAPPHWMPYFLVSKCDSSAAKAKDLGAKLYMEPMSLPGVGRFAVIADPQGAAFSIFEAERK